MTKDLTISNNWNTLKFFIKQQDMFQTRNSVESAIVFVAIKSKLIQTRSIVKAMIRLLVACLFVGVICNLSYGSPLGELPGVIPGTKVSYTYFGLV